MEDFVTNYTYYLRSVMPFALKIDFSVKREREKKTVNAEESEN